MRPDITNLEYELLFRLMAESESNGHDFGVVENIEWPDRKALGGLISSLRKKGFIVEIDSTIVDDQKVTQYVLNDSIKHTDYLYYPRE